MSTIDNARRAAALAADESAALAAGRTPDDGRAPPAPSPSRRRFIGGLGAGAAAIGALALPGCGGGDDGTAVAVEYRHGVASGDPLADRVILWTRLTTASTTAITVAWQVARDEGFAGLVASGTSTTDSARDWTVKVDATGLEAGTRYFYRFVVGNQVSPVGRTKTLPTGAVASVRLAVFSCSNYPAGYFHAYAEAARTDRLDASVHLGDYLYEYARNGYASANAAALGRLSDPDSELFTLADYRRRYAQYRTDPDLQALHAAAPMIAVWDDHEIANDAWRNGAENHQASEGSFTARRDAAVRVWHEWMPVRTGSDPLVIYRSFDFGTLLSLHMLDTRLVGRDEQLDYATFTSASGFNAAGFAAAIGNPSRELLGAAQTQWLQARLAASPATWHVVGQQVLMGRMNIPAPILFEALNPGTGVTTAAYAAIVAKAQANPGSLTPQEQALLAQPAVPYNLDAWDGYAAAREAVLGAARAADRNLVVLAGDTHNAWASDLADAAGNAVGVEFATPSVSSPGFEAVFVNDDPAVLAAQLTQLIGPLQYCDTARRGFLLVTANAGQCRADWVYVSNVGVRGYTASTGQSLRVLPGPGGRRITAV